MFEACFPDPAITPPSGSCAASGIDAAIDCSFAKISCIANETIFYSVPLEIGDPIQTFNIPLILVWIALCSIFFTLYLGFINIRYFGYAWKVLSGKYHEAEAEGELSNFQSLAASLAGTVGLGNIAGVAVAVSVGGPGAVLWMVVMGFLGMSSKFAEVTVGMKYRRRISPDNKHAFAGGPMYYVKDAFENRGIKYVGSILAIIFAISCIMGSLGGGNMFQANQAFEQFQNVTGGDASFFADKGWLFGVVLAALVGVVIVGGISSIGKVASLLVPLMAVVYLLACFYIIGMNFAHIPDAFMTIINEALSPAAGIGGVIGGMLTGIQRASFSNEAGLGSAAIVQATAKTDYPIRQGFVGMLGPFLDTVVVCLATALVIVITGAYEGGQGVAGVELTSRAMAAGGGEWMTYVLAVAVFLFAYSTQLTWYYYGEIGMKFILGEKKWVAWLYKAIYLGFVVIGCSATLGNVVNLTDAMFLSMAFANIVGLYLLAPEIKRDLKHYVANHKAG